MRQHKTTLHGLPVVVFYDEDEIILRSVEWREIVEMIDGLTPEECEELITEISTEQAADRNEMARDAWIEQRIERRWAA